MDRWKNGVLNRLLALAVIASMCIIPLGASGTMENLHIRDVLTGSTSNGKLGWNITNVGDLQGDGNDDYAIGSPGTDRIYIWDDRIPSGFSWTGANGPSWTITGTAGSGFGWSFSGIGDYDADGRDDLIVGAPNEDWAYVFKGSSMATSVSYTSASITFEGRDDEMFGHAVTGLDYDGFGNVHVAIGAPLNDHLVETANNANFTTGSVFIWNMTTLVNLGETSVRWDENQVTGGFLIKGDDKNGLFGFTVMNAGDMNGDGRQDLMMGDPFQSDPLVALNSGAAYVMYGKTGLIVPETLAPACDGQIYGRNDSYLGWSMAALGDAINADALDEVIIGAPLEDNGHAYLFSGSTVALDVDLYSGGTADMEFVGNASYDRFGWSMTRADIDSEHSWMLFIGAPGRNNLTVSDTGAIYGFYSPTSSAIPYQAGDADTSLIGDNAGGNLGYALMSVNYSAESLKLLASAPFYGSTDTGRLYVIERNLLPKVPVITVTPSKGNLDTEFTIDVFYQDLDNDPAKYVEVEFYTDQAGTNPVATYRINNTNTPTENPRIGQTYRDSYKLPNSVKFGEPDAKLWMRASVKAVRGSVGVVTMSATKAGPIVDGTPPSGAGDVFLYDGGVPENARASGTMFLSFDWPGDDDFGGFDVQGQVEMLEIRIRKGEPVTAANWDSSIMYNQLRMTQDPGKNEIVQIGGTSDDNPNRVPLDFRNRTSLDEVLYYAAVRAMDDEDNVGPIVQAISGYEPWWRRPDIPGVLDPPALMDYPEDDGTKLKLLWYGSTSLDTEYYNIYVDDEPFNESAGVKIGDNEYLEPDYVLDRTNDLFYDTYNISRGFDIEYVAPGEPVEAGKVYYAAVIAVNWLGQFDPTVKNSVGAKVIDDLASPISPIRDLTAVTTPNTPGNSVTLSWTPVTDSKFVEYQIYAREFSFTDAKNEGILVGSISDRSVGTYTVTTIAGEDVEPGVEYGFAILVLDHNDKMVPTLVPGENYVFPVRTIEDPAPAVMESIKGVTLRDKEDDDGGALILNWYKLIIPGRFWSYNIYFSDTEITSVSGMLPYKVIRDYTVDEIEINTSSDGVRLVDGKDYWAVVTITDWNDNENTAVEKRNNTWGPVQPVNQSDDIPPAAVTGFKVDPSYTPPAGKELSLRLVWIPEDFDDLPDFDRYLINYWREGDTSGIREIEIDDRDIGSAVIEGLTRNRNYFLNISIVDDNGNRGSEVRTNASVGKNDDPVIEMVRVTVTYSNQTTVVIDVETSGTLTVKIGDLYENSDIFIGGEVTDDYTSTNRIKWEWNLSTPDGKFISKDVNNWKISEFDPGKYTIKAIAYDDEDGVSAEYIIYLDLKAPDEEIPGVPLWLWIVIILVIIIAGAVIAFLVIRSSKTSQQKEMLKQYEDYKKEIDAMEPIYPNLPSWTCSCGTTVININKGATCPSCYESFEAVPIDGIDKYLKDHELVLAEMRIAVPLGWRGQNDAIEQAEIDLQGRKKRAREALDEQYAPFLGTDKKKEEKTGSTEDTQQPPPSIGHPGAIIPGQVPPPQTSPPMGQPPTMQYPPMQGQPQNRPPVNPPQQ